GILKDKLKNKLILILPHSGYVDDLLVEKSREGAVILTQDMQLKKRLIKPYLTIRQKKMLMMVE
ncbi:hypothetical protein J4437_00915, partial [Candidatus Woesearchaeota archaeon]|nr:hypothetical protein [Candidatus Woesearchaeota archaeon]